MIFGVCKSKQSFSKEIERTENVHVIYPETITAITNFCYFTKLPFQLLAHQNNSKGIIGI